jgi:hypothetical protein
MLAAGLFFLARDFKVRSWLGVHARRFDAFLAIKITPGFQERPPCSCKCPQRKAQNTVARRLFGTIEAAYSESCLPFAGVKKCCPGRAVVDSFKLVASQLNHLVH